MVFIIAQTFLSHPAIFSLVRPEEFVRRYKYVSINNTLVRRYCSKMRYCSVSSLIHEGMNVYGCDRQHLYQNITVKCTVNKESK